MNPSEPPKGVSRRDISRNLEKIGSGGQATVYRVKQFRLPGVTDELAYKEYKSGSTLVSGNGLRALIETRLHMQDGQRMEFDERFIWPLQVVVDDDDQVTGILMRLIPDRYWATCQLPSGKSDRIQAELQHLVCDPRRAGRTGMPLADTAGRLILCEQLAYAMAMLHRADVIFGDLNPRNVLYSVSPASILMVDCDAARKRGTAAVVGQFHLADWVPPEGMSAPQTVETDRFKLGLAILRLLCPMTAGSTGTDPVLVGSVLDSTGVALLTDSLSGVPSRRTSARDWVHYFRAKRKGQPFEPEAEPKPAPSAPTNWVRTNSGWEKR